MLQINLVGVMQKEVGNISEESTQDKYIYTRTHYIYTHMSIKNIINQSLPP